jgi:hypothetical protein
MWNIVIEFWLECEADKRESAIMACNRLAVLNGLCFDAARLIPHSHGALLDLPGYITVRIKKKLRRLYQHYNY